MSISRKSVHQERIDQLKNLLNSLNHGDNIKDWETVSTAIHTIGTLLMKMLKEVELLEDALYGSKAK